MIAQVEQPGTQLHTGWAHIPAPDVAKAYWKLPPDAMFVDTLKCMVSTFYHICTVHTMYVIHTVSVLYVLL